MISFFNKLKNDDRGATAIEYGLILALIFLAMVAAIGNFAGESSEMWGKVDTTVDQAKKVGAPPPD